MAKWARYQIKIKRCRNQELEEPDLDDEVTLELTHQSNQQARAS